ncbi:jg2063 [Pararge aegeria aegeria]|uniref:Jg2063 protein n=1 Tax=Pararge aegeria aegeria TaxID=348720 RepID=A0A8S4RFR5_9NEOP|nr:jg2063 [Pararge aegeria aegeria]
MCETFSKSDYRLKSLDHRPGKEQSLINNFTANESSEVEYLVLDLESTKTKVFFNKDNTPSTEITRSSECSETERSNGFHTENRNSIDSSNRQPEVQVNKTVVCYNCPNIMPAFTNKEFNNDSHYEDKKYGHRATNLIMKLREIKMQNLMLDNELRALKQDSRLIHKYADKPHDSITKVSNATSAHICSQDSNMTLNCLKSKLQEVQDSRKSLIEIISNLQDKLVNFSEIKRHEIEDLVAQHRLEIKQVETCIREELKAYHDKHIEELKRQQELFIKDIESKHLIEKEKITATTEATITEKDKIIQSMETDIGNLRSYIEDLKNNQYFMFSNFLDNPNNDFNSKCKIQRAEELEKRLNKMEKSKIKFTKAYEAKLTNLQKEKHLADCSLQLQLMKQRTQIINDTADEHQTDLVTNLDKLESKYKDIVANVQATAVQRRVQDQMALESIIQTVCGIRNVGLHGNITQATYTSQLTNRAMRNQTTDVNQSNNELPTNIRDNKAGSIIVGKKPFEGENLKNGSYLGGKEFSELFERVCVPQRDTGESSPIK